MFLPVMMTTGRRILVVDDNEIVLGVIGRLLEHLGFEVVTTTRPAAAIALVEGGDRDFVALITDIEMPEMFGPDLVTKLAKLGCRFPALYISGYVFEHNGAVLEKPFSLGQLRSALSRVLHVTVH